jgi:hypothetical protein
VEKYLIGEAWPAVAYLFLVDHNSDRFEIDPQCIGCHDYKLRFSQSFTSFVIALWRTKEAESAQ